ncbi:hypothetical protein DAPPUDRAFT_323482 [Daphnia pulex]|uniref:Uncharacterized protein n=1 Tax=Daphnia pulex TaxID=6669 RepID=E9GYY9_DAPPU|nr:hypothetical protein DAPPUDRAFT_323482 [Daphnia pulex]|eukprot:EFX75323.1 hypothetical protein DAPPUDRAFT_323482 [Daphnia pulex]
MEVEHRLFNTIVGEAHPSPLLFLAPDEAAAENLPDEATVENPTEAGNPPNEAAVRNPPDAVAAVNELAAAALRGRGQSAERCQRADRGGVGARYGEEEPDRGEDMPPVRGHGQ